MLFSIAPKALDVGIFDNPSWCVGDCWWAYAVSDVYFAEVCALSHICDNKHELFTLDVGTPFQCEFNQGAFFELRNILKG